MVDPWIFLSNDDTNNEYDFFPGAMQIESDGVETTLTSAANNYFLFNVE